MKSLLELALPYQREFLTSPKKRKIWLSSRQAGKSWALAYELTASALRKPGGLSLCVSTGARSAAEIIMKCRQFAAAAKTLTDGALDYQPSFDQVRFSNGSRVMALPCTSDASSLRGWTVTGCVALDEAAFIRNMDEVMQALAPTLSRCQDASLVLASTPAGRSGAFYDIWTRAQGDPLWHAQRTDIHEAVEQGLNVDVESLRKLCPDPLVFAQEYECAFQDSMAAMLSQDEIVWREPDSQPERSWTGVDIGRFRDMTAIVQVSLRKGSYWVDSVKTMGGAQYKTQLSEIGKAARSAPNFGGGYIDAGGIGSAVAEFAHQELDSRLRPFCFTAQTKTQAYEFVRHLAKDGKLFFSRDAREKAAEDVQNVYRVVTPDGQVRYMADRNSNGHGDIVSALVLALQAAKDMPLRAALPESWSLPSAF